MAIDVENTPLFQQRRATGAIIVRGQLLRQLRLWADKLTTAIAFRPAKD